MTKEYSYTVSFSNTSLPTLLVKPPKFQQAIILNLNTPGKLCLELKDVYSKEDMLLVFETLIDNQNTMYFDTTYNKIDDENKLILSTTYKRGMLTNFEMSHLKQITFTIFYDYIIQNKVKN